jgi:hypothetical protein
MAEYKEQITNAAIDIAANFLPSVAQGVIFGWRVAEHIGLGKNSPREMAKVVIKDAIRIHHSFNELYNEVQSEREQAAIKREEIIDNPERLTIAA